MSAWAEAAMVIDEIGGTAKKMNSTIGTSGEKPLDFMVNHQKMGDGHYYRPVIKYGLMDNWFSNTPGNSMAYAPIFDVNEKSKRVYALVYSSNPASFQPAYYAIDKMDTAVLSKSGLSYASHLISGILCDKLDDSVYYIGESINKGSAISKLNKDGAIIATVPWSGGFVMINKTNVYNILMYDATTKTTTIKCYNRLNLALINTLTLPMVQINTATMNTDGIHVYAIGYDYTLAPYKSYLFRIRTSDWVVVAKVAIGIWHHAGEILLDDQYIYVMESRVVNGGTQYMVVKRDKNMVVVKECYIGDDRLDFYPQNSPNARCSGMDSSTLYYVTPADSGKNYINAIDKQTMKFYKCRYSPISDLNLYGLLCSGEDIFTAVYASKSIRRCTPYFHTDGTMERVTE